MHKDYTLVGAETVAKDNNFALALTNAPIANRVSYFCNFHGPSLAIDTVCSSSLTALHLALESLRHGECDVALAGGVNLSLVPHKYMTYGGADMLSTDGRCRTFGEGGDGYVPAEGIGAVLLKPLEKALEDRDSIYAVIKASAVNHVGTVSGVTVPSPLAQADVIERCWKKQRSILARSAISKRMGQGHRLETRSRYRASREPSRDMQKISSSVQLAL